MYDLQRILNELNILPEWKDQICLQGVEGNDDPFFGCGRIDNLAAKEKDFTSLLFDIPYTNNIISTLGLYRTRVLRLMPGRCYSYHHDPTKRIHIPLITNIKSFLIIDKEVIHLPADGNHYLVDTTQNHTALNASPVRKKKERIHIVGAYDPRLRPEV